MKLFHLGFILDCEQAIAIFSRGLSNLKGGKEGIGHSLVLLMFIWLEQLVIILVNTLFCNPKLPRVII